MHRFVLALTVSCFLAPAATADLLVIKGKKKGSVSFVGIKKEIGGNVLNLGNVAAFADKSTGVIVREDYDGIAIKKRAKDKKPVFYPRDVILKHIYTTEPEKLLDGFDQMAVGAYAQAIGSFRQVASDAAVPPVHRAEANFQIGQCYLRTGNRNNALAVYGRWEASKSVYTPDVFRLVGELQIARKKFKAARAAFNKIGALPEITEVWKFGGRLGLVKGDIAEREFDDAEKAAKRVIARIAQKEKLSDPLALALTLQAKAILGSGNKDRLAEAETALKRAAKLKASMTTRAELYATLGDVQYAQGDPDKARFAYMRVPLLFRAERGFAAHALRNAGQCFLDMSGRAKTTDAKASDELFLKGMDLLAQCAGRHRSTTAGREAATAYRQRKGELEAARKRVAGKPAEATKPAEEKEK